MFPNKKRKTLNTNAFWTTRSANSSRTITNVDRVSSDGRRISRQSHTVYTLLPVSVPSEPLNGSQLDPQHPDEASAEDGSCYQIVPSDQARARNRGKHLRDKDESENAQFATLVSPLIMLAQLTVYTNCTC